MAKLFGLEFWLGNRDDFARHLLAKPRKTAVLVLPVTANEIVHAGRSKSFKKLLQRFDYLVTDGMPLVWLARLLKPKAQRIYGPDLMLTVLKNGRASKATHYFYGTTQKVLSNLEREILKLYPSVKIAGKHAPSFRSLTKKETQLIASKINAARPDFLWVSLGGAKQVEWAAKMKDKLRVGCIIPVGAAFDFIAGSKLQAPNWMQVAGLEWFFRLITEPKRLWKRYVLQIPAFLVIWVVELLKIIWQKLRF